MSAFIAKQPNGLYCRFSSIVDCPTHWNMTEEEYISNVTGTVNNRQEGEDIIKHYLKPFAEVVDRFIPNNMTEDEFGKFLVDVKVPIIDFS